MVSIVNWICKHVVNSNLISVMGKYILHRACNQLVQILATGGFVTNLCDYEHLLLLYNIYSIHEFYEL